MRLLCDAITYDDREFTHEHNIEFMRQLCDNLLGKPSDTGQIMELPVLVEFGRCLA